MSSALESAPFSRSLFHPLSLSSEHISLSRDALWLDLSYCQFPESLLRITNASRLQSLNLSHCPFITGSSFRWLPETLEQVSLSNCINMDWINLLSLPCQVEYIDLSYNNLRDQDLSSVPESVHTLNLSGCDHLSSSLASCLPYNVECVDISNCPNVDLQQLKSLRPSLRFTDLFSV